MRKIILLKNEKKAFFILHIHFTNGIKNKSILINLFFEGRFSTLSISLIAHP